MKKLILLYILSWSHLSAFSYEEYQQICKKENKPIVAISNGNLKKAIALDTAEVEAYGKFVENEFGVTVSTESFLYRAYKRLNDTEHISEDFNHTVNVKAKGIIFPEVTSEFIPDHKGQGRGFARAYVKRNCNSLRSYMEFVKVFKN
ncbi:MAG: hypothetical protein JJW00_08295 [Sulfurimonas sp.]|nr:hypothetical protein [Sulfurimonas sp.]